MNNAPVILRSLIVYAVCVPLAVIVGFMLTDPMDYSTLGLFGILALLLISPLLLRWHYPLLVLSWNLGITLFFIKGAPYLWVVVVALSLGLSVVERALNSQMRFIPVPQITWPLICLMGVILVTAKFTGGFGLHAFGSDVYGGKKYIFLVLGILSYFALTARRIPPERAGFYVGLYFLGGLSSIVGDLFTFAPSWAYPIFWFFPPTGYAFQNFELGETRLGGFSSAGVMLWCFLLAKYGIRGIFLEGKLWRPILLVLSLLMVFLGGYRGVLMFVGIVFALQFFMEGIHRTRLLPVFIFVGVLAAVAIVPLANKLPFTFQRTLAFLPLQIDPVAMAEAQDSVDWRVNMWKALMPQIPEYLLLGKGLAITTEDYNEMMGQTALSQSAIDPSQNSLALSYDYHNGPLSVIIPFGIWGCITVLWFFAAGFRVLRNNYRYGDPSLQTINAFLFAAYVAYVFQFMFIGGSLSLDVAKFAGVIGLSVALNSGMREPAPQPVQAKEPFLRPRGALPGSRPGPAFTR